MTESNFLMNFNAMNATSIFIDISQCMLMLQITCYPAGTQFNAAGWSQVREGAICQHEMLARLPPIHKVENVISRF